MPNTNFGIDHYRPKGNPRFASLICEYSNLFYCCAKCNSRKSNYWPDNEASGPYIVNPCDHEMASHLRFDSHTGRINWKTPYGQYTAELLQLNDESLIEYRLNTLIIVRTINVEIDKHKRLLKLIDQKYHKGDIDNSQYESEVDFVNKGIERLERIVQAQSGELPLRPLRTKLFGVSLLHS